MQNEDSLKPTLEYVISKVNDWRRNRKHRSELMSEELKILIVSLMPFYSINQISSNLRISIPTLYNFEKTYSADHKSPENHNYPKNSNHLKEQKISFVPFNLSSLLSPSDEENNKDHKINHTIISNNTSSTICQIEKKDGTKLTITTLDPTTIIGAFLCSN